MTVSLSSSCLRLQTVPPLEDPLLDSRGGLRAAGGVTDPQEPAAIEPEPRWPESAVPGTPSPLPLPDDSDAFYSVVML